MTQNAKVAQRVCVDRCKRPLRARVRHQSPIMPVMLNLLLNDYRRLGEKGSKVGIFRASCNNLARTPKTEKVFFSKGLADF